MEVRNNEYPLFQSVFFLFQIANNVTLETNKWFSSEE
jgi:hypothetical protein